MNGYTIETTDPVQVGDTLYRLAITYDPHGENPREWSDTHMGVMVAYHRNYSLPCEDGGNGYAGAQIAKYLNEHREYGSGYGHSFRALRRWLRMFHGASVVLPIYATGGEDRLYAGKLDDNGEGACGLIYDTPDTRRRGWGEDVSPATWVTVDNLRGEVDQYATWAHGEMTAWAVESYHLAHGEDPADVDTDDPALVAWCG